MWCNSVHPVYKIDCGAMGCEGAALPQMAGLDKAGNEI